MTKELYESDYYAWLNYSAAQVDKLGLTELKDYLEEMTRSEKRAVESEFARLIAHLLKWKYQPVHQSSSWRRSIKNARSHLEKVFKESPSLRSKADSLAKDSYEDALFWAVKETGLEEEDFPQELEFSLEQLLDKDYLPSK